MSRHCCFVVFPQYTPFTIKCGNVFPSAVEGLCRLTASGQGFPVTPGEKAEGQNFGSEGSLFHGMMNHGCPELCAWKDPEPQRSKRWD